MSDFWDRMLRESLERDKCVAASDESRKCSHSGGPALAESCLKCAAQADEPREWDAFTAEHDSDLAYWESHVEQTRRDVLNPAEWPALDAEIRRIKELRALVQSSAAPILAAVLAEVARQDAAGEIFSPWPYGLNELTASIARSIREALRLSKEGIR